MSRITLNSQPNELLCSRDVAKYNKMKCDSVELSECIPRLIYFALPHYKTRDFFKKMFCWKLKVTWCKKIPSWVDFVSFKTVSDKQVYLEIEIDCFYIKIG